MLRWARESAQCQFVGEPYTSAACKGAKTLLEDFYAQL